MGQSAYGNSGHGRKMLVERQMKLTVGRARRCYSAETVKESGASVMFVMSGGSYLPARGVGLAWDPVPERVRQ